MHVNILCGRIYLRCTPNEFQFNRKVFVCAKIFENRPTNNFSDADDDFRQQKRKQFDGRFQISFHFISLQYSFLLFGIALLCYSVLVLALFCCIYVRCCFTQILVYHFMCVADYTAYAHSVSLY